jgi:hypothetical protein
MYIEAKETARLYTLLSNKLGNDTTEVLFKYIDNKTERSVENSFQSLATKEDTANIRKEMAENQTANIKWMFVFWVGQFAATVAVIVILLKK